MVAKFAWNAQKNKMSDVVGKEREQERQGRLKNEDIDLSRSHLNYDLIDDDRSLYRKVNDRVLALKENGSRVQKNSVVMYSNIITLPKELKNLSEEEQKKYFEVTTDYFKKRFGEENVLSAKVHLDESTPHMHLHFVPVNAEGRLSARTAMSRQMMNEIHNDVPKLLNEHGFEIERGDSKNNLYIENVHEFKKIDKAYEKKIAEVENKYKTELQKQENYIKHLKLSASYGKEYLTLRKIYNDDLSLDEYAEKNFLNADAQDYFKEAFKVRFIERGTDELEINNAIKIISNSYNEQDKIIERGEEKTFIEFMKERTKLNEDELVLEILTKSRIKNDENYRNFFLPTTEDLKYLNRKQQEIERMNQLRRLRRDELEL